MPWPGFQFCDAENRSRPKKQSDVTYARQTGAAGSGGGICLVYNAIPRSTSNLYAAMIIFAVMQRPEWDFYRGIDEAETPWPDSPEERVDRFGLLTAALVCVAFFIAALWLRLPSFQKCSALENATERHACYDTLRNDLSKPPAKGPRYTNALILSRLSTDQGGGKRRPLIAAEILKAAPSLLVIFAGCREGDRLVQPSGVRPLRVWAAWSPR